jgi:Predicted Fe-S-cluster oxidoreductase
MDEPETRHSLLLGGTPGSVIAAVASIYERIELDEGAFRAAAASRGSALSCPEGCGNCCEHFVPDLIEPEALFLARYLLRNEPELAEEASEWPRRNLSSSPPCPFYRPGRAGGCCGVYPGRPLICRLFAFSGSRDKEGRPSFRPCARMPVAGLPPPGDERPSLSGPALASSFGLAPPMMADYAAEMTALSPEGASDRELLVEALPRALSKIGLGLALAQRERDSSYS